MAAPNPAYRSRPSQGDDHRPTVEGQAIDWLIEVLAQELASLPPAQRRELGLNLVHRSGYAVADDPVGLVDRRIALALRVAARLTA